MTRLVILISGRGSNMQAIVEACRNHSLDATVAGVISNRPAAGGLDYARAAGIPVAIVDHQAFPATTQGRLLFDQALGEAIDKLTPDLVVLAGFMRILGADLVRRYHGRMINIHPSLLPAYPGLNTHARVLAAGDREHGATVHYVTPELDAGPAILQSRVPVLLDDTEETLAARVLETEHDLFVRALVFCTKDKVTSGGHALAEPADAPPPSTHCETNATP